VAVRGRQVVLVVAAIVVAAVCVRLGMWQLGRLHGRERVNVMLAARGSAPPVDLATAPMEGAAYTHVTATGTYDPAHEVILSGRSFDGVAGNHVLTPLVLTNGDAVLVDRGWVPLDVSTPPVTGEAAAPAGTVRITGLALPPDAISEPAASPPPAVTTRIDLGLGGLPYRLRPLYVLLVSQDPTQTLPTPAPGPTLDEGSHLSYAIQWFAFATITIVGCVVLLSRDRRDRGIAPTPRPLP
jgi:surfeit locus 1 family protein